MMLIEIWMQGLLSLDITLWRVPRRAGTIHIWLCAMVVCAVVGIAMGQPPSTSLFPRVNVEVYVLVIASLHLIDIVVTMIQMLFT
jgi:hypothetical protein